jgi:hypothetical protein
MYNRWVARKPKWKSCLTSGAGTLHGGGYSWSFLPPVPEGPKRRTCRKPEGDLAYEFF